MLVSRRVLFCSSTNSTQTLHTHTRRYIHTKEAEDPCLFVVVAAACASSPFLLRARDKSSTRRRRRRRPRPHFFNTGASESPAVCACVRRLIASRIPHRVTSLLSRSSLAARSATVASLSRRATQRVARARSHRVVARGAPGYI